MAQQLKVVRIITESVTLVNLKFCVDPEITEPALALRFTPNFTEYDWLTGKALKGYLEEKSQESKDSVTLETLDGIVRTDLSMDMSDKNANSRMEALSIYYH